MLHLPPSFGGVVNNPGQKLVCLAGSIRVTASDGEFRDIGPGDVWHMEDKRGKGHHTRVTSDEDFLSFIVQLE